MSLQSQKLKELAEKKKAINEQQRALREKVKANRDKTKNVKAEQKKLLEVFKEVKKEHYKNVAQLLPVIKTGDIDEIVTISDLNTVTFKNLIICARKYVEKLKEEEALISIESGDESESEESLESADIDELSEDEEDGLNDL